MRACHKHILGPQSGLLIRSMKPDLAFFPGPVQRDCGRAERRQPAKASGRKGGPGPPRGSWMARWLGVFRRRARSDAPYRPWREARGVSEGATRAKAVSHPQSRIAISKWRGCRRESQGSCIEPLNRGGGAVIRHGWHLFPITPALSRENTFQARAEALATPGEGTRPKGATCFWFLAAFWLSYRSEPTCAFAKALPKTKNPRFAAPHLFCQCSGAAADGRGPVS